MKAMKSVMYSFFLLCLSMLSGCGGKDAEIIEEEIDPPGAPSKTWQEDWGTGKDKHDMLLQRVYYDDDVAIYFDEDMDFSQKWMDALLPKVWRYTKSVYGDFGKENRLYCIMHANKYSGGHPASYLDASHGNRNAIDNGSGRDGNTSWKDEYDSYGIPIHEVGHIVEGGSKGIRESPAFGIWGDSKWCEIYTYDVYKGIGMNTEAKLTYDICMATSDVYPRPGTHWFRDWFYPIYSKYGGSKVLNEFFVLLSKNFPTHKDDTGTYSLYDRGMNMGEFIHFWSGAAGVNLKEQATLAFGWSDDYEAQFMQAQEDFPNVNY
ncbi:hypothetical protein [Chryseolinea lacunae]|uniref:Lipoprotein n=1 Tax=Chryseolinea lacunae TaxID=2801331 RepID=A0ABS1KUX5_9BACT|nr:hypothetical protein [Chryseolinea lacunae]MBL0742993.1 hypothetical protein [Chryseolinea lacunae]